MKLLKADAATSQLDAAIHLFLEGNYLSALTLAGAAEEIFGALVKQSGKPTALDFVAAFHRKDTDPQLSEAEHNRLIASIANRARNAAKHANDPNETHVEIETDMPLMMIMRCRSGFRQGRP